MGNSIFNKGSEGLQEMMRTSGSSEHLHNISVDENKNKQPQTERERNTPGDPVFE